MIAANRAQAVSAGTTGAVVLVHYL